MDLTAVLPAVLTVTTLIAAGVAGLTLGTVRTLRSSNDDLRARVTDLEHGQVVDRAEIAKLRADNEALSRVVTGEAHWTAITELLNQHHSEAQAEWRRREEHLTRIETKMDTPR